MHGMYSTCLPVEALQISCARNANGIKSRHSYWQHLLLFKLPDISLYDTVLIANAASTEIYLIYNSINTFYHYDIGPQFLS